MSDFNFTITGSELDQWKPQTGLVEEEEEEQQSLAPFTEFSIKGSELDQARPRQPIADLPEGLDNPSAGPLAVEGPDKFYNVEGILKEYGRPLVKEDFLKDERLQFIMRKYLSTRFSNKNERSLSERGYRIASTIAGGSSGGGVFGDYEAMDPEDLFETFQNHQRSFAGGQSVTTANELATVLRSGEADRAALGAGYSVFDAMDNAFVGEGTWAETADAIWDYGKAAVWDPTTILTLGIGKAISAGSTKAGSLAFKQIAKTSMRELAKKGLNKAAASKTIGAMAKAAPYLGAEMALNVGNDVMYQNARIRTGNQEEFSLAQTGLTAAGSMIVPAFYGINTLAKYGRSKLPKRALLNYKAVDDAISAIPPTDRANPTQIARVWDLMRDRLEFNTVVDAVDDQFGRIEGDPTVIQPWVDAIKEARVNVSAKGQKLTNSEAVAAFEKYFFFGNPEKGVKGYYQALNEAGFTMHPYMLKEQKTTGIFGDTIKWLDDDVVKKAITDFEDAVGQPLGIGYTAQEFSDHFKQHASDAGKILNTRSTLARLENAGLESDEVAQYLAGVADPTKKGKPDPKRFQFMMSTYKRLLTSHLATTGANIRGFAQLSALDAAADVYSSVISYGLGSAYKVLGDPKKAAIHFRRSYGSLAGTGLRAFNVLNPEMPIEYAGKIIDRFPEIGEKLFREVSGDAGTFDNLKMYNLDEAGKAWRVADGITKGVQSLTLVRMQDDITKRWAFGNSVDQAIMREYGTSPLDFWSRPDVAVEMNTTRFKNNVLDKALNRTLRETASLNWSTLSPEKNFARQAARGFETLSNKWATGFLIPFGSFMNTTFATFGDLTGINAARVGLSKVTGMKTDFATNEGVEKLSKFLVGATMIGMLMPHEKEKAEKGLAWNQEDRGDGSIRDLTFDWPGSVVQLMARIASYGLEDDGSFNPKKLVSDVPQDLKTELGMQTGGQAIRDFDDALTAARDLILDISNGEFEWGGKEMAALIGRIPQAAFRSLDPVNNFVGVITGGEMNPDRRQGSMLVNETVRYFDQLLPGLDRLPTRAYPTEGKRKSVDVGKQLLGTRSSTHPTLFGKMLNSASMAHWKTVRFDGPPEVKNRMDEVITPIFESNAIEVMGNHPDFFKYSQEKKEHLIQSQVIKPSKEQALNLLKNGYLPPDLDAMRRVSMLDKDKVKKVMKFLQIDDMSLVDIADQEDGFETLNKIIHMVENYEDMGLVDMEY